MIGGGWSVVGSVRWMAKNNYNKSLRFFPRSQIRK